MNNPHSVIYSVPCCCTLPSHALQEYIISCWCLLSSHRMQLSTPGKARQSPTVPGPEEVSSQKLQSSTHLGSKREHSREALEIRGVTKDVTSRNAYLCLFHKRKFCTNIHKNSQLRRHNPVKRERENQRKKTFSLRRSRSSLLPS